MSRDIDWHVFDKAADITASAVRGAMGSEGSQPATYVGAVPSASYAPPRKAADEMPSKDPKPGLRSAGVPIGQGSDQVDVERPRRAVLGWYRPRRHAYSWRRGRR